MSKGKTVSGQWLLLCLQICIKQWSKYSNLSIFIFQKMFFFKRKYSTSSKFTGWKTEKQVTSWLCMLIVRALSWDTTALRSCCCTMNHSCIWYRSHWNNVLFHGSFSKPRSPRSHKRQGVMRHNHLMYHLQPCIRLPLQSHSPIVALRCLDYSLQYISSCSL